MSHTFLLALLASILASIGGLSAAVLLIAHERTAQRLSRILLSFAAGILLGVTFLDLLPEALDNYHGSSRVFVPVFLGVVACYLLERAFASFHRHEDAAILEHGHDLTEDALRQSIPLVIFGDSVHNFIDGITVAVTFVISIPLGIATAFSVFLHELPHEIADFTILLRAGMDRKRVLQINVLTALIAPVGTVVAYVFATGLTYLQAPLLAIAGGNLLYVSMTDLLPHLHHEQNRRMILLQVALFLLGVLVFFFVPRG